MHETTTQVTVVPDSEEAVEKLESIRRDLNAGEIDRVHLDRIATLARQVAVLADARPSERQAETEAVIKRSGFPPSYCAGLFAAVAGKDPI